MRFFLILMLSLIAGSGTAALQPDRSNEGVRPGLWRVVERVVAASSPTMPPDYLERLRRKADGRVTTRCIHPFEADHVSAFGKISGRCSIDRPQLRGGRVAARLACPDRNARDDVVMTGTYTRDRFDITATVVASGSVNRLANARFTTRAVGRRIGDCS